VGLKRLVHKYAVVQSQPAMFSVIAVNIYHNLTIGTEETQDKTKDMKIKDTKRTPCLSILS